MTDTILYQTPRRKPRRDMLAIRAAAMTVGDMRRLICPRPLSSNVVLQPEESEAVRVANFLREVTLQGRLNAVWLHVANEAAGGSRTAKLRYAKALNMGMIPGMADYLFLPQGPAFLCELKVGKGRQNDNQIAVEKWARETGLHYHLFYSAGELEQILIDERVLTNG
ncbi:hypothetical protein [Denitrobaculum tricleocarpae]|uniref:VRR-NUC domain-containing protein n=1 Tax=Denitrobaculum tricleocarpae TaxID=2591009 RepID=A0A545TSZ5_9PROT|nr:hypothetical protein [Denitrobaculum tricleocarpae]TQV80338.1 hypothetical protein FKG95_09085 [Denitrobaculum tricleocarpae]